MRHIQRKQRRLFSSGTVACTAVLVAAMAVWHFQPTPENNLEMVESASNDLENPFAKSLENPFLETAEAERPVYPYSVVAGGVRGVAELRRAVARDRVVAAHYADFDVSKARVVKLSAAKTAYVSYRLKNRVYWTRKKVTLAKGETLITDGKSYARARCANRVSDSAQAAVSPQEPSPTVLDTPVASTSPLLMAYLPSSVRYGFAPESHGGSTAFGGPGSGNEGGTPSGGFYGRPGFGGGAFLPGGGGGGNAAGSPTGGGTPGSGTPGDGVPAGGTGSGAPGGGSSGSIPPVPGTPASGTGTPGQGNGNGGGNDPGGNPPPNAGNGSLPGGNTPDNQPSNGGSTPPSQGGGPGISSSPGANPPSPPGKGSEPNFNPSPQGGGSTPPPSNSDGPGNPSSPEQNPFTPPGEEGDDPPVDVTTPPDEGGPGSTTPTAPVPEPASIWLLSAGAASLLALRRRRK